MLNTAESSSSSRRIAKNTLLLYIRMLVTMVVGLFTSRVVLNTLGVEDYGICNVVGGFVSMFAILTNSMSRSISRYLTYELGVENSERLPKVFATSVNIQVAFSIVVCLFVETVGVWFLNNKMVIPAERITAANWVLQCSLVSMVLGLLSVPYNASIVAHERMDAFAYISILETSLKLLIVYMLYISPGDKLVVYSILGVCVSVLIRFVYAAYCKKHFKECRYRMEIDKPLLKEMTGFAGWSFFDNGTYILNNQGINVLMNLFFGVAVNAARGIAVTVDGTIRVFAANILTAFNPQIVKNYAAGNFVYVRDLVLRGTKYCCFLIIILAVPICAEAEMVLRIWLKIVPDYTVCMVRLAFMLSFVILLGEALQMAIIATDISIYRKYQKTNVCLSMLIFPLTWVFYKLSYPYYVPYIIYTVVFLVIVAVRVRVLSGVISLKPWQYYRVALLATLIGAISFIPSLVITAYMEQSILRFIITTIVSIAVTVAIIYTIGMSKDERNMVKRGMNKAICKIKKN